MHVISATPGSGTRLRIPPARVWTLALLDATSAVGLAGMAAAPLGSRAPTALYAGCAGVLVLAALVLLASAGRIGNRGLLTFAGVRIVIAVAALAAAPNAGATFFAGAGFVWVALWVTGFFAQRVQRLTLVLEAAGLVGAASLNGHHLRTAVDGGALLVGAALLSMLLLQALGGLRRQARHDHLTGLMNRYGLDDALAALEARQHAGDVTSVVAVDLDGLKLVNDQSGHLAGDRMLVTFATELSAAARGVDLPARVGGDEFIAVLPGLTAAEATRWACQLQQRSCVRWSFGVAERRAGEPLQLWLGRADQGMYAAKPAGRDRLRPVAASS